jgi:hypothetical protein
MVDLFFQYAMMEGTKAYIFRAREVPNDRERLKLLIQMADESRRNSRRCEVAVHDLSAANSEHTIPIS